MSQEGLSSGTNVFIGIIIVLCLVGLGVMLYMPNNKSASTPTPLPNVTGHGPYSKFIKSDINGHDLFGMEGTLGDCRSYCDSDPHCLAFTTSRDHADGIKTGLCNIKTTGTVNNTNAPEWIVWQKNLST
jgi:hypothetical protein